MIDALARLIVYSIVKQPLLTRLIRVAIDVDQLESIHSSISSSVIVPGVVSGVERTEVSN
jgi:hypothetical protein